MISISHRTKYQQYIYLDGPNPPSNKQIPLKIIAYYIAQQRKDNKSWMAYWQYCHDLNWWLECRKNVLSLSEKFLKVRHVCCVMIRLLVRGNRGLLVNFGQFIEAYPSTEKHQWPVSRNGVQRSIRTLLLACSTLMYISREPSPDIQRRRKKNKRTRQLEPVRVSGSKNKTDRTSFHLPHIFSPPICNFFFPQKTRKKSKKKIIFFINIRVRYLFAQREMKCPLDGRQSDESGTNRVTRITPQFLLVSKWNPLQLRSHSVEFLENQVIRAVKSFINLS